MAALRPPQGTIVHFLRKAVSEGIGVTAALSAFREAGYGIRTNDFRQLFRVVGSLESRAESYRNLYSPYAVPEFMHSPAIYTQSDHYLYNLKVGVLNHETGEVEYYFTNVSSGSRLTPDFLYAHGEKIGDKIASKYDKVFESVEIVGAFSDNLDWHNY